MNRVETAVSRFRSGMACSQAILSAYGEGLGLDYATAIKLASGFGGGMGRMAETCGAVTGAFMVLGLRHSPADPTDRAGRDQVYQLVRRFAERFRARAGSIVCRDLLHYDISTPEGLESAKQKDLFMTVCPGVVQTAAEVLEELV